MVKISLTNLISRSVLCEWSFKIKYKKAYFYEKLLKMLRFPLTPRAVKFSGFKRQSRKIFVETINV